MDGATGNPEVVGPSFDSVTVEDVHLIGSTGSIGQIVLMYAAQHAATTNST